MKEERVCGVAYSAFIIKDKGDVYLCRSMEPIGNIKESTPEEIWNSKKAEEIRERIKRCNKSCKVLNCNYIDHEK